MNLSKCFPRTSRSFLVRFLMACLVIPAIVSDSIYAQDDQEYEVGDIVDVTSIDETFRGIVTEAGGWPRVKYLKAKETTESEEEIELLEGEEIGNGAKVRFKHFSKPKEGVILGSQEERSAQQRKERLDRMRSRMSAERRAKMDERNAMRNKNRPKSSGRGNLPKRWDIEFLVEEEGKVPDSKVRLVRRPKEQIDPYESRSWTDATGKFNVQAKFVARDGETIELIRDNGKELKLPLKKLSKKDRKFLSAVAKQEAENPLASTSSSASDTPPTLEELFYELRAVESIPPKLLLPKIERTGEVAWNVAPDPAEPTRDYKELELPSVIIGRKASHNSFSKIHSSTPDGASAIGVYNFLDKRSAALLWKTGDSKATKFPIVEEDTQLFAISPDAKVVVGKQGSSSGSKKSEWLLYFWNSEDASTIDTWDLNKDVGKGKFAPLHGRFVADKKLVTIGKHAVCWDLEDPKSPQSLYAFEISSDFGEPRFAFSPNNKILAVENRDQNIYFIDPVSGKCNGILADPFKNIRPNEITSSSSNSSFTINSRRGDSSVSFKRVARTKTRMGAFTFSPNGKLFAGTTRDGDIFVWDLVKNELAGNFFAMTYSPSRLKWADDDHLLVGNKLVNVRLGAAVWGVTIDDGVGSIEQTSDGQVWGLSRFALTPLQLVPDDLSEQLDKLRLDKEDLLAISPESKIAIKWSLPSFNRNDKSASGSQPQQKLRSNITRNGQTIDNNAEIVVASTLDPKKTNRLRIADIISSKERGFVEEKPKVATIQCKLNDEILWSRTRLFGWNEVSLQTEGNESFQQAVDRLCTPTRSFYDDFYIPQYFYRLPGGKLLGESKITKAGVTYEN